MINVISQVDCGNAPKKQFVYDFCVATASTDIDAAMVMVTDDIRLHVHGFKQAVGREAVREMLVKDAKPAPATELVLVTIITHGNQAAANGVLKFDDGGRIEFCNVYRFNNFSKSAKIQAIDAYSIAIE